MSVCQLAMVAKVGVYTAESTVDGTRVRDVCEISLYVQLAKRISGELPSAEGSPVETSHGGGLECVAPARGAGRGFFRPVREKGISAARRPGAATSLMPSNSLA